MTIDHLSHCHIRIAISVSQCREIETAHDASTLTVHDMFPTNKRPTMSGSQGIRQRDWGATGPMGSE